MNCISVFDDSLVIHGNVAVSHFDDQPYSNLIIQVRADQIEYEQGLKWYNHDAQTSETLYLYFEVKPEHNRAALTWEEARLNTETVQWQLKLLRERNARLRRLLNQPRAISEIITHELRLINQSLSAVPKTRLDYADIVAPVTAPISNEALRQLGAFEDVESETVTQRFDILCDNDTWRFKARTDRAFETLPPKAEQLYAGLLPDLPQGVRGKIFQIPYAVTLKTDAAEASFGVHNCLTNRAWQDLKLYRQIVWRYHPILINLCAQLTADELTLDLYTPT